MPHFSGMLGSASSAGGVLTLGGPPVINIPAPPTMATTAKPYIAHLYSTGMAFKGLLGPLLNAPMLKWSLNAGFHPITIELPAPNSNIALGDLIYLSVQGGSSDFVYGGKVESLPRIFGPGTANFQVALTPFVAELGDGGVNLAYTAPTDLAVMIRDAVSQTSHCAIDTQSCPMTGIKAINNFNNTSPLDVLNTCRKIGGKNYWWFVDQYGVVWFQTTGSTAYYTFKLGADYSAGKGNQSIQDTKNYIYVVGGWPAGASAPITSTYNGVGGTLPDRRQLFPNPVYSTVTDQGTLDNIATTLGNALDRVIHTTEVDAPQYGKRVVANLPGGPMMRYWEEAVNPLVEAGTGLGGLSQAGVYSATYVGMDNEITLPQQKVIMGDLPIIGINDLGYEIGRVIAQGASDRSTTQSPPPIGSSVVLPAGGYLAIKDLSGNIRHELGTLPAYTDPNGVTSIAHYGSRDRDASGNLLADSIGLAFVSSLLGSSVHAWSNVTFTGVAGPPTGVTGFGGEVQIGGNVTFSLARQTTVRMEALVAGTASNGGGVFIQNAPIYIRIDGRSGSSPGQLHVASPGSQVSASATVLQVLTLPAGSYTARLWWNSANGVADTLSLLAYALYAFQLGG